MSNTQPAVIHTYRHHFLDSPRWEHYRPRSDDIVIATPYKSGTTWMQIILGHLIFQDLQVRPIGDYSPWLENPSTPVDEVIQQLDQQTHRRFIKTHLALDGLPYHSQIKYIVVGRDARDVFMSLWNHYSNFTDHIYERDNPHPDIPRFPRCPANLHAFWQQWITSGWFEWESEGYPFWSNLRHVRTWWDFKHLPNILFVHFSDLLNNLEGELQRITTFLDIDLTADLLSQIAHAVTFETVKMNAEKIDPGAGNAFKGGAKTFFNKGTNGRWRNVLNDEDLALYAAAVAREMTPDCAHWLEHGRLDK